MKKQKKAWAGFVNLAGVWGPIAIHWDEECQLWCDDTEDIFAEKSFTQKKPTPQYQFFASENKVEVETWVEGAKAAQTLIRYWATNQKPK